MTDIIKNLPMTSSKDVLHYLRINPNEIVKQVNDFREEMNFSGTKDPVIIAFGKDTYKILQEKLGKNEYSHLVQLTHYSHQKGKEKYRSETHRKLYNILGFAPPN